MNTNTETETNRKIKFTHGENGEMDLPRGNTALSYLFMIGAFASTQKYVNDEKGFRKQYQTDAEGLDALKSRTSETLDFLSDVVAALGEMMVRADLVNVSDGGLQAYSWLISGLGDLMREVAFEDCEIATALRDEEKL